MVTTDLDRSMKGSKRADQLYLGPTLGMTDAQQNILSVTTGGTTAIDRNVTLVEVNFAGAVTIQLPSTVNVNPNLGTLVREAVTIVDISGAAGTNNITILPFGSELIIGLASISINSNYASYTLGPLATGGWTLLDQNPSSVGMITFETRTDVQTTMIPVLTTGITTMGYAAVGDDGDAIYRKVGLEPTHLGKVQSADGAWWEVIGAIYKVGQFGAVGNGVADDTASIQSCIDTAGHGGVLTFSPDKTYLFTSTLTQSYHSQRWIGGGINSTRLHFNPSAADTAILVSQGAALSLFAEFSEFTLYAIDTTFSKIAFDLSDVHAATIKAVRVAGATVGVSGSETWGGTTGGIGYSIGIVIRGRDFIVVDDECFIQANNPITITANPNSFIDCDHTFIGATLVAFNQPCIIAGDTYFSNTTISGSWNAGTHGFYFVNTSGSSTHNLVFRDVRHEQAQDPLGYSFYVDGNNAINGIFFDNVLTAIACNGFYLDGIVTAQLNNVMRGIGTGEFLTVSSTVGNLVLSNCFSQVGATVTIDPALFLVLGGPPVPVTGSCPNNAWWSNQSSGLTTNKLTAGGLSNTGIGEQATSSIAMVTAGAAGSSGTVVWRKTGIPNNVATAIINVRIPNGNHNAAIFLDILAHLGTGTDASESSRCATGCIVIARQTGVATAAVAATLATTQIATVAGGGTLTLAYSVGSIAGGVGVLQAFNIELTLVVTGTITDHTAVVAARCVNSAGSGITISGI